MWFGRRDDGRWLSELLSESTSAGPVQRRVVGIGLAVPLFLYSADCMVTQTAVFLGSRPLRFVAYFGLDALAVGLLYLFAAIFLHAHWFWSNHPRFYGYAHLAKHISAVGVIGGAGYLIFRIFFRS